MEGPKPTHSETHTQPHKFVKDNQTSQKQTQGTQNHVLKTYLYRPVNTPRRHVGADTDKTFMQTQRFICTQSASAHCTDPQTQTHPLSSTKPLGLF